MTFSHKKSVLMKTNYMDVPLRYPPYKPGGVRALGLLAAPRPKWQFTAVKVGALAACAYVVVKLAVFQIITDLVCKL